MNHLALLLLILASAVADDRQQFEEMQRLAKEYQQEPGIEYPALRALERLKNAKKNVEQTKPEQPEETQTHEEGLFNLGAPTLTELVHDIFAKKPPYPVPVGISAAVVNQTDIVWEGYYGHADMIQKTPVTPNTTFILASVSKTITAVGVLKVWEDHLQPRNVSLDDDITFLLPFKIASPTIKTISLNQLLHHVSGIIDDTWVLNNAIVYGADASTTLAEYMASYLTPNGPRSNIFYNATKNFGPQGIFSYSNFGFALLGYVCELASGVNFANYTNDNLLTPLGIGTTGPVAGRWHISELPIEDQALPDGLLPVYSYPGYPNGGFRATAGGLAHVLRMMLNQGILQNGTSIFQPQTAQKWQTIDALTFATSHVVGMQVTSGGFYGTRVALGHTGGDIGVATAMFFVPGDCPLGVIVLTNQNWPPLPYPGLVAELADMLLNYFQSYVDIPPKVCRPTRKLTGG